MPASKCFVPGCKSGYKTCSTTSCFFQPPRNPVLFKKWQQAIPRADRLLSQKDKVCEHHFSQDLVEKTYKINVGGTITEVERGRAKLDPDAVPRLFPNLPKYLSKEVNMKRKRRASPVSVAPKRVRCEQDIIIKQVGVHELTEDSEEPVSFIKLHQLSSSICPASWTVCASDDCISFCKLGIVNGQGRVIRSVSVSSDLKMEFFYKEHLATVPDVSSVLHISQLTSVFQIVEDLHECPGNAEEWLRMAVSKSRIAVFVGNTWRHTSCTWLTNQKRCQPCSHFRRVLQTAAARQRVNQKKRSRARVQRLRAVHSLRKRVDVFRSLSLHLKKSLTTVSSKKLDDVLTTLPANQQLAVKHCFRQIQAKSARGMRYDHKWILACILLRIKSPKAYEHLREHSFLTLPAKRTLARYIDVIRVETGISEDAIKLVKQRVTSPAERHGLLMFDEVKLREGIKFNTGSMEFEGLVDFSEFQSNKNNRLPADTGLVFMYRPIMGGWVQSVGMYLSKGPTPSSVLSKILLKLLLALESHGLWVGALLFSTIVNCLLYL